MALINAEIAGGGSDRLVTEQLLAGGEVAGLGVDHGGLGPAR